MRPSRSLAPAAVAALALAVAPSPALARTSGVVVWVEGTDGARVRAATEAALDLEPMKVAPFATALRNTGERGDIGPALADASKRPRALAHVVGAGKKLHARVVLVVSVTKSTAGGARARLLAVDVERAEVQALGEVAFVDDGAAIAELAKRTLAPTAATSPPTTSGTAPGANGAAPMAATRPPSPTVSAGPSRLDGGPDRAGERAGERAAERAGERAGDRGADRASRPAPYADHAVLLARVGGEIGGRQFHYNQALTPGLRPYGLSAAPLVVGAIELYPWAAAGTPIDVGIRGRFAQALGLSSTSSAGDGVGTRWQSGFADAVARWRTSQLTTYAGAGYGQETFALDPASTSLSASALPSADYRSVRAVLGATLFTGLFAWSAEADYDAVIAAGASGDRFARARAAGVEGRVSGRARLPGHWEIGLAASYRRFFYAFHSVPGDALVAGGAVDEYYGAEATLGYVY